MALLLFVCLAAVAGDIIDEETLRFWRRCLLG